MADIDHPLERRAHMLAGRLSAYRDTLRDTFAPKGQRRPFTEQMSQAEAIAWWRQHRYDQFGKDALAYMQPEDILELDLSLARANEADLMGGQW